MLYKFKIILLLLICCIPMIVVCQESDDISTFFSAIGRGDTATISDLIVNKDVDVNSYNKEGILALLSAYDNDQFKSFELLLQNGADPNVVGVKDGDMPLAYFICSRYKTKYSVKAFKFGLNPDTKYKASISNQKDFLVFRAIRRGEIEVLSNFILFGVDTKLKNFEGKGFLQVAVEEGSFQIACFLITRGYVDLKVEKKSDWWKKPDISFWKNKSLDKETLYWHAKLTDELKRRGIDMYFPLTPANLEKPKERKGVFKFLHNVTRERN